MLFVIISSVLADLEKNCNFVRTNDELSYLNKRYFKNITLFLKEHNKCLL